MENGEAKEAAPQGVPPPQARCWIDQGILRVEVPLFMPNGEFIAYGMLHKAMGIAEKFILHIEGEAKKDAELRGRILTPAGVPRPH